MNVKYIGSGYSATLRTVEMREATVRVEKKASDISAALETNSLAVKQTFVGATCVEFFDEDMKEVLKLNLGLISTGITGQYKGSGNRGKQRFEIRGNSILVTKQ